MDLLLIARKIWRYKLVDAAHRRLDALRRGVCRRGQGAGLRGVVQLRPDQSTGPADRGGDRPRPVARPDRTPTTRIPASPTSRWSSRSWRARSSSESARRELVKAGADRRYTVAPSSEFGYSEPDRPDHRRRPDPGGGGADRQAGRAERSPASSTGCSRQKGVDPRYRITTQPGRLPRTAPSYGRPASFGRWWRCSRWGQCCCSWSSRWPTH